MTWDCDDDDVHSLEVLKTVRFTVQAVAFLIYLVISIIFVHYIRVNRD